MLSIFLINTLIVGLVVITHYECLRQLALHIPKLGGNHRHKIILGVFGCLTAHAIEVWLFAIAFYFMHHLDNWGYLTGNISGNIWDMAYFSFSVYTTLGFGDIEPNGALRYLTGIEALTGLVLIAWSASFLYFEMQTHWAIPKNENTTSNQEQT